MKFRFDGRTQLQMCLLLYYQHVGVHLDGHQHGLPTQSSINLGETLFRITRE